MNTACTTNTKNLKAPEKEIVTVLNQSVPVRYEISSHAQKLRAAHILL